MLQNQVFCSEVDFTARKGYEWSVSESEIIGEGCGWTLLRVSGIRKPRTAAAVVGAVCGGMYEGYSGVSAKRGGGAEGESFQQQRSALFCLGCSSSILYNVVYQQSTVPGERQGRNGKWSNKSEESRSAV